MLSGENIIIDSDCMDCECCCEISEMFDHHVYLSVTSEKSDGSDEEDANVQRSPDGECWPWIC
jgi:hypothetical protein